jgi:hypothetical protein
LLKERICAQLINRTRSREFAGPLLSGEFKDFSSMVDRFVYRIAGRNDAGDIRE